VTLDRSSIICFAATRQSEQAREFYQDVLGLRLVEDTPFALVFDANGTMLRVQKVMDHRAVPHTVLG
jgi:catechol 2,3-dioxygenase-like lactoylglutathione lyase family enzyme